MIEFRKIHDRGYDEDPAFRKEINRQQKIHEEYGACPGSKTTNEERKVDRHTNAETKSTLKQDSGNSQDGTFISTSKT